MTWVLCGGSKGCFMCVYMVDLCGNMKDEIEAKVWSLKWQGIKNKKTNWRLNNEQVMTKLGTKGFQHFPQPLLFYAFASKYKWQG